MSVTSALSSFANGALGAAKAATTGLSSAINSASKNYGSVMTSYQPSVASTAAGALQSSLNSIYNLTQQNTARSEAQARELRDWQEQQTAAAQQFNSAEAAKNRDWQKMMSDTAHQREVADLRAAGLNPVLSAMGGQGASTTSGATASASAPNGSQGQVDTSMSQALVSLLGTLWTSQTEIEMQRASAENNLAIAEKNKQASESVAEIYGQYGLATQKLAGEYGVTQAQVSGAYGKLMSEISAAASRYGSDQALASSQIYADASKYAADMGLKGTQQRAFADSLTSLVRTGADFLGGQLTSKRSSDTAKSVAELQSATSKRGQNLDLFGRLASSSIGSLGNIFGR